MYVYVCVCVWCMGVCSVWVCVYVYGCVWCMSVCVWSTAIGNTSNRKYG